jgi:hypothetical protein
VDVVPGLAILVLVLTVHLYQRQRDAAAEAQQSAREAEEAKRQTRDMARLVNASHALANALDHGQLRVEAWRHVPALTGGRTAWVAALEPHTWHWIMEADVEREAQLLDLAPTLLERTRRRATVATTGGRSFSYGAPDDRWGCSQWRMLRP